jgi:hypothetical protein
MHDPEDARLTRRLCRHSQGKGKTDDGGRYSGYDQGGNIYEVHYALYNPHGLDQLSYQYPNAGTLVALLRHYGIDSLVYA